MSDTTTVSPVEYAELGRGIDGAVRSRELDLLGDVDLQVTVQLGAVKMTVRELLSLEDGSVLELDRAAGAAVDVLVNGRFVARGDVVVIDEELGVRITEIVARP
ncbi:MAG: flagellar motor switch protein FliN [Nitriliruptor sp.]|uniref:flagellar motor switch protein FliN n=1 Tax=Nitriliruptor sp. TaxID=2448056 RepID=UPI0034A04B4B